MRTIKSLFTALAAGSLAVIMASSAFAAPIVLDTEAYDAETGVIDATGYTTTAGQMTAIVVEAAKWNAIGETDLTADDLLYINQFDSSEAATTLTNIGLKGLLTEDVEYYVLLGGENATDIQVLSVTYTEKEDEPQIAWGDVDGNNIIDNTDFVTLFRHTTGAESLILVPDDATANQAEIMRRCNVDGNNVVDNTDAVTLFRHTTGAESIVGMGLGDLSEK